MQDHRNCNNLPVIAGAQAAASTERSRTIEQRNRFSKELNKIIKLLL